MRIKEGVTETAAKTKKPSPGEGLSSEKEQATIRLPVELKKKLEREAARRGVSLHDMIAFILWEDLQHIPQE